MRFWKLESVGNDFVLVEGDRANLPQLARVACDRRFGIGADGLLAAWMQSGILNLRMFNPDGTEDFCGNGLRCALWHGLRRAWFERPVVVRHFGRDVTARWGEDSEGLVSPTIETDLGRASWRPEDVPLAEGLPEFAPAHAEVEGERLELWSLSTGSTHTVVFCDRLPESPRFERLGRALEHHPAFPERTSVMFAKVVGRRQIRLRIWERGVGETLACGSGTCATASAYVRKFGAEHSGELRVESQGGVLSVRLHAWDAPLVLRGRARCVFEGELTWPR
ncbi:MAG: diaminopimelate epimerase [Fimbriimonadales bacterium]|nr:diaminopimelate epimerase [Fimbriimonadales bacterium]